MTLGGTDIPEEGIYCPDWYLLLRAARYLGVAPWDLADQPMWWTSIALAAQGAEQAAEEHERKRSEKRNRKAG